jgi:pentatricopeptide repeat domain-containing protein 1
VFDRQVERNVISYNTAMSSCEKSSCWEIVLSLLQSLKSVDAPNEISCAAALTACGKGQKWQLALQIFHSIASWHETINLSTYQLHAMPCHHSIFKSHFEGTRSDVNFRIRPRPVLTAYAAELHLR